MLYADKHALRTRLKVSLLVIRHRELQFYTKNCIAIGTNALFLASFAWWGLTEPAFDELGGDMVQTVYLVITAMIMALELLATVTSTLVAILGPALAIRGPDGAMHTAVDCMVSHYRFTFVCFALGLVFFQLSVISFMHMQYTPEISGPISVAVIIGTLYMLTSSWRIYSLLKLRAQTMVTGDFAGGPDEIADSMALPPHELTRMAAAQAELQSRAKIELQGRDAPQPSRGRSWLGRARAS
ncbi:hypothetical protein T492DRAFT_847479 [Pavlovales sp. CCMP2436]|nr:hypothetical protein T492DRAFT_847479 [Pavlovales sp. CCMP2436]|mmetsp:Transcript_2371/g.5805  ORF Transcript_2371/g.5805 Transcript_2371/m.5805 type:complete len:241 (+) Transcript_2371:128-850(+)